MTYKDLRQPSQDELRINLERRDKIHKPSSTCISTCRPATD